jgi:hypothetical protein
MRPFSAVDCWNVGFGFSPLSYIFIHATTLSVAVLVCIAFGRRGTIFREWCDNKAMYCRSVSYFWLFCEIEG